MSLSVPDSQDFSRLTERFRPALRAHCYRLMGSLHDAEDMVQETLLRAWQHREALQDQAALRAWLYKIATNVCLDALKKQRRRFVPLTYQPASTLSEPIPPDVQEPIWLEPYPDEWLRDESPVPEAHLIARESITLAFIAALQLLPPRQRAALILAEVMEFPAIEIAELLGMTLASVKSALHRARATLAARGRPFREAGDRVLDEAGHARLAAYVRAWECADSAALIALLSAEATFSMPPIPAWYQGRETIRGLVGQTVFAGKAMNRWRLLPTGANRQPAFGLYRQEPGGIYHAYGIQVLTLQDGLINDIITFRVPALFPRFGLPAEVG
ncbi:MAG: RNA polymerase subunit sigma-70 [Anaerolineae bacterium]|nr:RNA polymerase subunit sigma-70 [Anaerolineae bacterium]